VGPPVSFFPYVDVTLHKTFLRDRSVPKLKDFKLYTLQPVGQYLKLVEFEPAMWRRSIWVDENASWGFFREVLGQVGSFPGFMDATVPVPWDMSKEELEELEVTLSFSNSVWRDLPLTISRSASNKVWRLKGVEVLGRLATQHEFVRTKMLRGEFLINRSQTAHPVSFFIVNPEVEEEWALSLRLGYLKGYEHMASLISRLVLLEPG